MSVSLLVSDRQVAVSPRDIVMFNCPSCGHSLRVPRARAQESGSCPLCAAIISAPFPAGTVSRPVATEEKGLPPRRRDARSFVAHKIIMPSPDVPLDDSWKKRYETDLKAWRKRKEFEEGISDFFESRLWKRFRLVGIALLMGTLAAALAFVYSEKKMGRREQGVFDALKKTAKPF